MAQTNQLLLCIENLFVGRGTQEANQFLQQYSETKECWESAVTLLTQGNRSHVSYFCANILYNKVRKNWVQLNDAEKQQLFFVLVEKVQSRSLTACTNDEKALTNRLILALCGACIRIPNGLQTYFGTALQLLQGAQNAQQALTGLEMIAIVPEEVAAADVSRSLQEELSDQLHTSATQFAQLVDSYSAQARDSRELLVALLRLLRAWLGCGLPLSKLYSEHRASFDLVVAALLTSDVEIVAQGCGVLKDIVVLKEYPRPAARTEALRVLAGCLAQAVHALLASQLPGYVNSSEYRLNRFFSGEVAAVDPDSDIGALCAEYSSAYATLASSDGEAELLCTGYPDPTMTERETELLVTFHSACVALVQMRPRKMAASLFDFWTEFDGFSLAECHPHVRESVAYEYFCVLVGHSTYPAEAVQWSAAERDCGEEQEDFECFRDGRLGLPDTLRVCLNSLQGRFFAVLQSKFEQFGQQQLGRWMQLEVVLFVLHSCVDAIKKMVMNAAHKDPAYLQSIVQFLYNVTCCALSIPSDAYTAHRVMPLHQAVCKFIGALTFLLVGTADERPVMQLNDTYRRQCSPAVAHAAPGGVVHVSDFYFLALRAMLEAACCRDNNTAGEAARAVHKLCVHGWQKLTDSAGNPAAESWLTLLHLVHTTAQYVQSSNSSSGNSSSGLSTATLLVLVEASTRTAMRLPSSALQTPLLSTLGESIIQALLATCAASTATIDDTRVVALLSLASQLIRFSDVPARDGADIGASLAHPLLPFLIQFWPVLQQISSDQRLAQCPGVGSAIFEIFGKVLMSVGSAIFSEVGVITSAILGATSGRSASAGAALACAQVLVETLSRHAHNESAVGNPAAAQEIQHLLLQLIVSVTEQYALSPELVALAAQPPSAGSSGDCMRLFGAAPDAMEQFFGLVHSYLVFRREDFVTCAAMLPEKVLALSCACLAHCTERDPLRALLHALQGLFVPTIRDASLAESVSKSNGSNGSSGSSGTPKQLPVLQALSQCGARLVLLLLQLLSDGRVPAGLVPNITETLYCLIIACETPIVGTGTATAAQSLQPQCAAWVEAAVMTPALFAPLTELSQRQVLGQALLGLAGSRSRRFKSLLQDLHKVCGSELTVDTLLAYAD